MLTWTFFYISLNLLNIFFDLYCFIAIIGIVGCADALKATSLIFGRVPNANKTTTTSTTTSTTTVATVEADPLIDDAVSKKKTIQIIKSRRQRKWRRNEVHFLFSLPCVRVQ